MESPTAFTPPQVGLTDTSSSASYRPQEDVASLTSFNPFSEEDEHDQSSYALMTSLFSKVKNTFTTPLSSAPPLLSTGTGATVPSNTAPAERRRPATLIVQNHVSESSRSSH